MSSFVHFVLTTNWIIIRKTIVVDGLLFGSDLFWCYHFLWIENWKSLNTFLRKQWLAISPDQTSCKTSVWQSKNFSFSSENMVGCKTANISEIKFTVSRVNYADHSCCDFYDCEKRDRLFERVRAFSFKLPFITESNPSAGYSCSLLSNIVKRSLIR